MSEEEDQVLNGISALPQLRESTQTLFSGLELSDQLDTSEDDLLS